MAEPQRHTRGRRSEEVEVKPSEAKPSEKHSRRRTAPFKSGRRRWAWSRRGSSRGRRERLHSSTYSSIDSATLLSASALLPHLRSARLAASRLLPSPSTRAHLGCSDRPLPRMSRAPTRSSSRNKQPQQPAPQLFDDDELQQRMSRDEAASVASSSSIAASAMASPSPPAVDPESEALEQAALRRIAEAAKARLEAANRRSNSSNGGTAAAAAASSTATRPNAADRKRSAPLAVRQLSSAPALVSASDEEDLTSLLADPALLIKERRARAKAESVAATAAAMGGKGKRGVAGSKASALPIWIQPTPAVSASAADAATEEEDSCSALLSALQSTSRKRRSNDRATESKSIDDPFALDLSEGGAAHLQKKKAAAAAAKKTGKGGTQSNMRLRDRYGVTVGSE